MQVIQYFMITITLSGTGAGETGCLFRMVNSNTSIKKTDVIESLYATSLVVCSLKCCNVAQCGWVAIKTGNNGGNERRCLTLMTDANPIGDVNGPYEVTDGNGGWDIYKREISAKKGEIASTLLPIRAHERTTTTTAIPTVITTTLYERIKNICEVAKAGSLPIYSRINSVNKWRCHAKSQLVLNEKFYGGGTDYIESKDDEIKKAINEHPSTKDYYVGGIGLSCQNVCSNHNNKKCQSKMDTLDSAYFFFAKADIQCNFDRSSAMSTGPKVPYYDQETEKCYGFINDGTVNCDHSPGHKIRRLCKCT